MAIDTTNRPYGQMAVILQIVLKPLGLDNLWQCNSIQQVEIHPRQKVLKFCWSIAIWSHFLAIFMLFLKPFFETRSSIETQLGMNVPKDVLRWTDMWIIDLSTNVTAIKYHKESWYGFWPHPF